MAFSLRSERMKTASRAQNDTGPGLSWVPRWQEGRGSEELAAGNFHPWSNTRISVKPNELHRWIPHTAKPMTYRTLEQQKKSSLSHAGSLSKIPARSHSKLCKAEAATVPKQTAVTNCESFTWENCPSKVQESQTSVCQIGKHWGSPAESRPPAAPGPPRGEHFQCESHPWSHSQVTNYSCVYETFWDKTYYMVWILY